MIRPGQREPLLSAQLRDARIAVPPSSRCLRTQCQQAFQFARIGRQTPRALQGALLFTIINHSQGV